MKGKERNKKENQKRNKKLTVSSETIWTLYGNQYKILQ